MIKFINEPSDTMFDATTRLQPFDATRVKIEHTIMDSGATLHDMLEEFQRFLLAIGYAFKDGDYLSVANDETFVTDVLLSDMFTDVNRVEVIDGQGRAYGNHAVTDFTMQLQDHGETVKMFLKESPGDE
jgi:hypothetical protein|tara:strand:- start:302 stop:688 length:387 start_codon:yes stop_codon:yes gene_type:complete